MPIHMVCSCFFLQILAPETTLWLVEILQQLLRSSDLGGFLWLQNRAHKVKEHCKCANVFEVIRGFGKMCLPEKKLCNFHLLSAELFRSLEADWIPQSDPCFLPRRKVDGDGTSRSDVHREPVAQLWDDTGRVTSSITFCRFYSQGFQGLKEKVFVTNIVV